MAYEQRDNSGSLFKNDRRENENHPNATGKAMIGGRLFYVSAWTKEGSKGKFQSLSFKPVDEAPVRIVAPRDERPMSEQIDDDLPF